MPQHDAWYATHWGVGPINLGKNSAWWNAERPEKERDREKVKETEI